MPTTSVETSRPPMGGLVWDIVLNATIPVILYELSKHYLNASEFTALAVACIFPLGKSVYDLARRGHVDPVAIVVLLSIAASGIGLLFGGSARLLLIRESLFTGVFGIACFVSLLFPRPIMFYFGRFFMAGNDPQKQARFDSGWRLPEVRFCHRLITTVWGCVFVGELMLRIILIYTVSPAVVLVISPILIGSLTIGTIIWALSYGHRVRLGASAKLAELENPS